MFPLPIFCLKEIITNTDKDLLTKIHVTALPTTEQKKGNKCPTLTEWLRNYTNIHSIRFYGGIKNHVYNEIFFDHKLSQNAVRRIVCVISAQIGLKNKVKKILKKKCQNVHNSCCFSG